MTSQTPAEVKLTETLAKLEQALLTPLVAGEIRQWNSRAQAAAESLSSDLADFTRDVLRVQYADIARTAPELTHHLEQLMEEDGRLVEKLAQFLADLQSLESVIDLVDPQKIETMFEPRRKKTVDEGVALILDIRKQQLAASTWFEEAQYRDVGIAAD